MKKTISLLLLVLLSGCAPHTERIDIAGSTTVLPIVQAEAEEYMNAHPAAAISVRGGGSQVGITSIINGTIDIGIASRPVTSVEKTLAAEKGVKLIQATIAHDAVSVVVHKNNPVNNLSLAQLQSIFAGKLTNWMQVGGPDMAIAVISRDVSSGSFEVFSDVVLDSVRVVNSAMRLPSNNAVVSAISYTPGAIGYVGLGYLNSYLKALSIDDSMPSVSSVQDASYPLARPLFMITLASCSQATREFIDFVLSASGQQIVARQGYVPREEMQQ